MPSTALFAIAFERKLSSRLLTSNLCGTGLPVRFNSYQLARSRIGSWDSKEANDRNPCARERRFSNHVFTVERCRRDPPGRATRSLG